MGAKGGTEPSDQLAALRCRHGAPSEEGLPGARDLIIDRLGVVARHTGDLAAVDRRAHRNLALGQGRRVQSQRLQ